MRLFLPLFAHTGTIQEAIPSLIDRFSDAAMPFAGDPAVLGDRGTTLRSPRCVTDDPRAVARAILSELPGHFEMTPLVSGPERDTLELFFRGVYRDLSGLQLNDPFNSTRELAGLDTRRRGCANQRVALPQRSLTPKLIALDCSHRDDVAGFIGDSIETGPEFFENRTALFEAYKLRVPADQQKPLPASEFWRLLLDCCPTAAAEKQKRVDDRAARDLRVRGISGVRLKDEALCRLPAHRRFRYRYIGGEPRRLARSPWAAQHATGHANRDRVIEHARDGPEQRRPAPSR